MCKIKGRLRLGSIVLLLLLSIVAYAQESVDRRSGRLLLTMIDLIVPAGSLQLEVQRTLVSEPEEACLLSSQWRLNWESRLQRIESFVIIQEDGGPVVFESTEGNIYKTEHGERIEFVASGSAVRFLKGGVKEFFDSEGRLIERNFPNNNKIYLQYDENGRLIKVMGPKESFLKFLYDEAGRIKTIEASNTNKIDYLYEEEGLQEVRLNGGTIIKYEYDKESRLAAIFDPLSGKVNFVYDAKSRIISRRWEDGSIERHEYNDANNSYRLIDPSGAITTIQWSREGKQEEIKDPLGGKTELTYDDWGLLLSTKNDGQETTQMTYDSQGRIKSMIACCGMSTQYQYVGDSPLIRSIIFSDGSSQDFEYDSDGNLTSIKEGNTLIVSKSYYPDGLLESISGQGFPNRWFTYDRNGYLKSETDALGHTTEYDYDERGNLIHQTDPLGSVTKWTYDKQNRVNIKTDAEGSVIRYEYETNGRLLRETDPFGFETTFEYDKMGRVKKEIGPGGRITGYLYNRQGQPSSISDPEGNTWHFEYDGAGNLTKDINPLGGATVYTYNSAGRIIKQIDPTGQIWEYEYLPSGSPGKIFGTGGEAVQYVYSQNGSLQAEIGSAGRTTRYQRDRQGQITKIIYPSGLVEDYTYDHNNNIIHKTDTLGMEFRYEYDDLNRIIREKWASGYELNHDYDALGNAIKSRDNQGFMWTRLFDKVGRVLQIQNPDGATINYKYDKSGRIQERSNALKQVTRYTYTQTGGLKTVTEPTGEKTGFSYNPSGVLNKITLPSKGETKLVSDGLGNRLSLIDPLGRPTKYEYDKAGRLIRFIDAKGQETVYTYDAADRISQERYADGRVNKYKYNDAGDLIEISDGEFPVLYSFDDQGRLLKIEYPAIQKNLNYTYDSSGLLSTFIDPEGRTFQYGYDKQNNLKTIRFPDGRIISYTYDSKGLPSSIAYPNGVKRVTDYNAENQVTAIAYSNSAGITLSGWKYSYDRTKNLMQISCSDGRKFSFSYDPVGRITSEKGRSRTTSYSYLPGGNRSKKESKENTIVYAYDKADQILAAGSKKFTHDANGNLVERKSPTGITQYEYDARNFLVRVVLPDGSNIRFGYSPTRDRIWREDKNGRIWYVTDGENLLAELDGDMKVKTTYLHGPEIDRPLMMRRQGKEYFYHSKKFGTIAELTDSAGRIAVTYDMDAFGDIHSSLQTEIDNPFLFAGREYDSDLGLYYFRARYYDPDLGRFITPDPLEGEPEEPATLNQYVYARNAPTLYIDPFGLFSFKQHLAYWQKTFKIPKHEILRLAKDQHVFNLKYNKLAKSAYNFRGNRWVGGNSRPYSFNDAFRTVDNQLVMSTGARPNVNIRSPAEIIANAEKYLKVQRESSLGKVEAQIAARASANNGQSSGQAGHNIGSKPKGIMARWRAKQDTRMGGERVPKVESSGSINQTFVKPPVPPRLARTWKGGANLTTGALAATALLVNHQACLDEGIDPIKCLKSTLNTIAIGLPVAALSKAAITKLLSAIVGPVMASVMTPYVIVLGAIYGALKAGERWAEAPAVLSAKQWEHVREKLKKKFSGINKDIEDEIKKLVGLRSKAVEQWQQVKKFEQDIQTLIEQMKGYNQELEGWIQTLEKALGKENKDKEKPEDLKSLRNEAEQLKKNVIDGITRVKALAADIRSNEQAQEIIRIYNQCKKNTASLIELVEKARSIKTRTENALNLDTSRIEEIQNKFNSDMEQVGRLLPDYYRTLNDAIKKRAAFESERTMLLERIKLVRRFFPADVYAIKDKQEVKNFEAFNKMRSMLEGIQPINEFNIEAAEMNYRKLIADFSQIENKNETIYAKLVELRKEFKDFSGEEELKAIEAAARDALRAMAGTDHLLQKARDYLAGKRDIITKRFNLSVFIQNEKNQPISGASVNIQIRETDALKKEKEKLQRKLLKREALNPGEEQLLKMTEKGAVTNAEGNAQLNIIPGWNYKIQASAAGHKSASLTRRINAATPRITISLSADATSDKIFLLNSYHTEPKLRRIYGPRVSLFMPPYSDDPGRGGGYFVELWYVDAGQAKALQEQMKKNGDKNANLPIHDLFRHLNLAYGNRSLEVKKYSEPYTIGIECNGQKRYYHSFWYEDSDGSERQGRWGGGFFYGLSPGEKEANVTAFDVEGKKMAEFPVKFIVEQNPDIDMNEKRKMIREARANLSKAAGEPDRVAVHLAVIIQLTSSYEIGPPSRIFSQFGQFVQAWHNWVRDNLAKDEKFYDPLGHMGDICERVATPEALNAYEGALSLLESNFQRVRYWDESYVAKFHRIAATYSIMFANDFKKALQHLERSLQLDDAAGKDVDKEKVRKTWPRFGKEKDKKLPLPESHSEREGARQ